MKVKELIEILKTMPQDLVVMGLHPDSGWPSCEINMVEIIPDSLSEEQIKHWESRYSSKIKTERFVWIS